MVGQKHSRVLEGNLVTGLSDISMHSLFESLDDLRSCNSCMCEGLHLSRFVTELGLANHRQATKQIKAMVEPPAKS